MAVYELVAVSRTPQSATSPTLTELGPIVAPTITWLDELAGPGRLSFSCTPERLESSIQSRFLDLAANPLEIRLYRDGTVVFAGPVFGYQIQGGSLSVTAPGLLAYAGYMWVTSDLTYTATDQFTIAKGLVDHWQALTYGNFGIDTSAVGTSGVTRDRAYLAVEQHNILQRLLELSKVDSGFDVHVNPSTRALVLSYPTRGSDLSAGTVLDARNIVDAGISASVAPGDLASEAFGQGTGAEQTALSASKSDTTIRAAYGRTGVAGNFDGVSVQATLDGHTQALLDARTSMLFQPGPGLIPVADVDVGSFSPGDTIRYEYDAGLGLQSTSRRVASVEVSVDGDGTEAIAVGFV